MSNPAQAVLSIGGAFVGFWLGGPAGAAWGFQIGGLAGSALFPTDLGTVSGPRLNDLSVQVSTVGAPIPIVYGTFALSGNVIWSSGIIETVKKTRQGGKGGPTQTVKTYTYKVNCAVGVCEGEIGGILRVWADAKLIYDARPQQTDETDAEYAARVDSNAAYVARMEVYTGTHDQEPDPTIESFEGVGNVSGFRGLAYVVFNDFQLADYGNRIPQFRFEVTNVPVNQPVWDVSKGVYLGESYDLDTTANGPLANLNGMHVDVHVTPVTLTPVLTLLTTSHEGSGPSAVKRWNRFEVAGTYTDQGDFTFNVEDMESALYRVLDGTNGFPTWAVQTDIPTGTTYCADGVYGFALNSETQFLTRHVLTPAYDNGSAAYVDQFSTGLQAGKAVKFNADGDSLLVLTSTDYGANGIGAIKVWQLGSTFGDLCNPGSAVSNKLVYIASLPTAPGSVWVSAGTYYGLCFSPDGTNMYITQRGSSTSSVRWYTLTTPFDPETATYQAGLLLPGVEAIDIGWHPNGTHFWLLDDATRSLKEYWLVDPSTPEKITLGQIVSDICSRCGLDDDQIDVTDLTETVDGYAVTRPMPSRDAISPLRPFGRFDCVESDGVLKWPTRGKAAVATLTADDLAAHPADGQRPSAVETERQQTVELPRRLRVHYAQASQNYDPGEQSASRLAAGDVETRDLEIAISMTATKAAQIAEVSLYDLWVSRNRHRLVVDQSHLALEPADAITVPIDGRQERLRIVSIDHSLPGLLRLECVRDDDGVYESYAVGAPAAYVGTGSSVAIIGDAELLLLDLPALRDSDDDAGYYAAIATTGNTFSGAVLYRSPDGGATYDEVAATDVEATIGTLDSALPAGPTTILDDGNELVVTLGDGDELESVSETSLLAGLNAAAIGADGRWEVIQFRDAELAGSPPSWRLTGLLRGRRGTEHNVGTSQAGDSFVLLDSALMRVPMNVAALGASRKHKAVLVGASIDDATAVDFAGQGVALEPFAPVYVAGERTGGDLVITWIRRDRFGQELPSGTALPMSESSEAYEVDVMDGVTVLRTLTSTSETATYTAAMASADFGSMPGAVTVRVYQMSATVGRGYVAEATV